MEKRSQEEVQEKDSKTFTEKEEVDAGAGLNSGGDSVGTTGPGGDKKGGSDKGDESKCSKASNTKNTKNSGTATTDKQGETKTKTKNGSGGHNANGGGARATGNPRPGPSSKTSGESNGKEKEGFPSLFISHATINISGSNPDISESERHKHNSGIGKGRGDKSGVGGEGSKSKTDLDSCSIPQRVVVHRVCSDSRIGEGEGFHSSKLAFYTQDGSFTNSLKALGLSLSNTSGGPGGSTRGGSMKNRSVKSSKQEAVAAVGIDDQCAKETSNNKSGTKSSGAGTSGVGKDNGNGNDKIRNESQVSSKGKVIAGGGESGGGSAEVKDARENNGGKADEATVAATAAAATNKGNNKSTDLLPVIEQSLSESKTEHPSTSEGEETIIEDVVDVDEEEEFLDEYDEPNENLDCQLDFDAAVTELLLRPEKTKYKDSATWTQEDDMPSPLSDFSPVASPRRKKERGNSSSNNNSQERDRDVGVGGTASGHSHNSLLEQYHQYLLEQQQQHQQPQVHRERHSRGGSGSKSGGGTSGGQSGHHHSHSHSSHHNPKSSIVGIHQGNLKSHSHSHNHPPPPQIPLPPPPPQHQQAECFTVSSQLLSREAKLYENVPATQGELETLEILLASGGSGDSNYPPSGGSGSGGGASNTTASTSNTSGTSGQSHHHQSSHSHNKSSSGHGTNNLNNNNHSSGDNHSSNHHHSRSSHHSHHHSHHQQQPQQHHHHHSSGTGNHHLLHQGYVHGQHSHSATNLNTSNSGNSAEQLFSVSDFLGPAGLSVGNNGGGPPSRTSWADSGRESLSFDGENNNSSGSTRNLLLIPPPPPPPINYLASTSAGHSNFGNSHSHGSSSMMHSSHHHGRSGAPKHSSHSHHTSHHHSQHHHSHSQLQSSADSPSHTHHTHNTKRSRRERLVRQKHAINDETIIPQNVDTSGFMAVPSPRRGLLPGGHLQASNIVSATASPINLQRHPPASQIMLQENKKNGPLIPCESPYGIMAGGTVGTVGTGDWGYPETFGDNFRRPTNKSHLTSNLLRSRSPQRGVRGFGGENGVGGGGGRSNKGNNSSFDYGELPSHQMFPKRHLLTSRQFSGHRGYSPGTNGTMQNNGTSGGPSGGGLCPPTAFQPMQHRSFPAGVFSGVTPRSCSMGDLTSSAASLNGTGQGHHANHHPGKTPEALALSSNTAPVNGLQPSTVPLVTSLPLPPATSVTYEFSLAPVSGTLAPGWHLTAVQRGLATAVPLAAAVARRRLPRPRTTRPRFGFTDKNEARRAKWTIVVTALALLAMSMLLVGVTLRLAPLIDDLGSSSSGSFKNQSGFRRDPLSRRASGDALEGAEASSYSALSTTMSPLKNKLLLSHGQDCSGSEAISDNNGLVQNEFNSVHSSAAGSGQNLNHLGFALAPQPLEKKMCALLASRSGGNPNPHDESLDKMKRQISMSLSIPSRQNSVRSDSSSQSYGPYSGIAAGAAVPLASISGNTKLTAERNMTARTEGKVKRSGSNPDVFPSSGRMKWRQEEKQMLHKASCRSLAAAGSEQHIKAGESVGNLSSFHGHGHITASSGGNIKSGDKTQSQLNERVTWVVHLGFSFLLILAVTCIVVFLRISANTVRKENENLLHSIQPKLNLTTPQPSSSHNSNSQQVQDNSIGIEDKGGTGTGNDKSIASIQNGQSLTRKNQVSFTSSDNTGVEEKGDEGDQQTSNNNNETTHDIFEVGGEPIISKGDGDETGEGGSGNGDSSVRSNNNSKVVINTVNNNDKENPSLKINSIRPKRSRPRSKLDENSGQNLLISVFNENNRVHANNDTPPGLTKTRHLESSLIRFLRNNSGGGQGQSGRSRERRNLEGKSRKL